MNSLEITRLRPEKTHQYTTFDHGINKKIPLRCGEKKTLARIEGRGYIAQLWLTFPGWFWQNWDPSQPINPSILKTLILRIFWDGEERPAVEAPVGDFFGIGLCETANFTGRYFGMSSGGFFCRFPMPFARGFRLEMENLDREIDTKIYANILYQISDEMPADRGYFHAHFHSGENKGADPLRIARVAGCGHYAGCTLSIQALERNYLGFLEAPEYVYVDEDWEQARLVGSGLEDYFLGGWYYRDGCFHGELHGLPVKDALHSMVAMYRVHEADAIHFQKRLRFEFADPFKPEDKPFRYSSVAFLYLDSPGGAGPELPSPDTLLCWYRIRDRDHQSIP